MAVIVTEKVKELAAATKLNEGQILKALETWNNCDMHKILVAQLKKEITQAHLAFEDCDATVFRETQGKIKGLKLAIATLNNQKD